MSLLLALAVLAAPARAAETPAASAAEKRAAAEDRRKVLAEMWQRRLLPPDSDQWGPEEMSLLARIRGAESAGALSLLKSRLGTLKGWAVGSKPAGAREPRWRLTKDGYDKYLFLKSQDAIHYFEVKGVDTKWIFSLTDLEGRRLFDAGVLTEAGETVYTRALAGLESRWKTPSGEVMGNRPPPKPPSPSRE